MSTDFEDLPAAVRALAEKYPQCMCNDFSCCQHATTRQMMEKIVELTTTHQRYATDDGEELLWQDLANVAVTALRLGDEAIPAIQQFLEAALQEADTTLH